MTGWGRLLLGLAAVAAIAHVVFIQRCSGSEILRLEVPIPPAASGLSGGTAHASTRLHLSPEMSPLRALCRTDSLQVSATGEKIVASVGGYSANLSVRTPSGSWKWEHSASSAGPSKTTRGVEFSSGPSTTEFGSFDAPAEGDYVVEVDVSNARFLRSMDVLIRSNTQKYDARLLIACGLVALLALVMGRKAGPPAA